MQQSKLMTKETLKTKVLVIITALAWAGGLLLAGSDGPFMPYLNAVGVVVFLCASLVLGRMLPRLEAKESMQVGRPLPKMPNSYPPVARPRPVARPGRRRTAAMPNTFVGGIHPRYAREMGVV